MVTQSGMSTGPIFSSRPDVIVDFIFEQGLFHISVENIGDAPAVEVSVKFSRDIRGAGGMKSISNTNLFRRITFMPPGKQIITFLDTSASYFRSGQPSDIEATINFSDRSGNKYTNKIKHNLEIYRDIGWVRHSDPGMII